MTKLLTNMHVRRFAVPALIAIVIATLCVSVGQLYASQNDCIDYLCSADSDCLKVAGCDTCPAGTTRRCATKVEND